MKKWFAAAAACMAFCLAGAGICRCAEDGAPDAGKRRETFGIYATYVAGEREDYTAPVQNGSSELRLPDGTVISAGGVSENALTLVVYPITEKDTEAWEWVLGCMAGKGSRPVPYEIYFLDAEGNYILADGVEIAVTPAESVKNPSVFALETDGTIEELPVLLEKGTAAFTADGRRYYVLAQKEKEPETETETETQTETETGTETETQTETETVTETETETENKISSETDKKPEKGARPKADGSVPKANTPLTGDNTDIAGWSLCLILAGAALLTGLKRRRKC